MKKLFLVIMILIPVMVACELEYGTNEIGCIENYDSEKNIDVNTFEECFRYTRQNIKYDYYDSNNILQTPKETIEKGTGDCEDKCLLTSYLLNKIGYDSYIVRVKVLAGDHKGDKHIILYTNGHYYEAEWLKILDDEISILYEIKAEWSYCETIWLASNRHKLPN